MTDESLTKLNIKDKRLGDVEEQIQKMQARAKEFCQTRSQFQLEKFIACDEYTPITQFRHVGHNSYVAMEEIRRMIIELERKNREIKRKQDLFDKWKDGQMRPIDAPEGIEDYDLDIFELTRQLEDIEIRIKGLSKEVDYMEAICNELEKREIEETGSGFTSEKYQQREPEYWRKRFANQMHRSQIGQQLGVGEGNYNSMIQAMEKPILPESHQQIEPIPLDVNAIATIALKDREGVGDKLLTTAPPPEPPQQGEFKLEE